MASDISISVIKGGIYVAENNDRAPLTEAVYYILLAVQIPMHGYGIMQFVKQISNERVNLGPGTLYGAINTLLGKRWIRLVDTPEDTRKKEYEITKTGQEAVREEIQRLEELLENGKKLVRGY